jgi:hypothetical protein
MLLDSDKVTRLRTDLTGVYSALNSTHALGLARVRARLAVERAVPHGNPMALECAKALENHPRRTRHSSLRSLTSFSRLAQPCLVALGGL